MRLVFRPLPKLTIAAAIAFSIMVGLGVWQLQRLQWKLALIEQANGNLSAPVLALDHALSQDPKASQYHRVAMTGRFDNTKETFVFTTGDQGAPVYHVVTPLLLADGRAMMVDRGFIPINLRDVKTRNAGELEGVQHVVGVWRVPDAPGMFTPVADLQQRVWYVRDVSAMAKSDGLKLAAPVIVEADATPNLGGWPKGGQTVVQFHNDHLQYAITWFALAIVMLAVYLAYHRSRGRLSLV